MMIRFLAATILAFSTTLAPAAVLVTTASDSAMQSITLEAMQMQFTQSPTGMAEEVWLVIKNAYTGPAPTTNTGMFLTGPAVGATFYSNAYPSLLGGVDHGFPILFRLAANIGNITTNDALINVALGSNQWVGVGWAQTYAGTWDTQSLSSTFTINSGSYDVSLYAISGGTNATKISTDAVAVPEPSTWLLVGSGAALLFFRRRRIGKLLFLLPVLVLLPACSKPQPPKEQIEAALKTTLPPYLEISDIKISTEEVFENEFRSKVTARVSPKEDLFATDTETEAAIIPKIIHQFFGSDRDVEFMQKYFLYKGGDKVDADPVESAVLQNLKGFAFIKRVAAKGEPITIYGTVTSGRIDSKFVIGDGHWQEAEILTSGQPRSAFPAEVTVTTPGAVETKVAEISDNVTSVIEAGKMKEEARKDKIKSAFAKGKYYSGIWTDPHNGNTGKVDLRITESDGRTFEGVLFDLAKPEETKPATGVIKTDEKEYHATLVGVSGEGQPHNDPQIEGMHRLDSGRITRARTYYRFLEKTSTVDFRLQIQEDGNLSGEGMFTGSYSPTGKTRGTLEFRPQTQ